MSSIKKEISILIVDDDIVNRKLLNAYLSKKNINCLLAENGKIGVELYEKNEVDLVFMDLSMPVMDGFQALEEIRKIDELKAHKVLVIAQTAFAMSEDKQKCIDYGFDDYISKPVNFEKINESIERIV